MQGRLPDFSGKRNEEILISKYLANRLGFKIGDKVNTLFGQQFNERVRIMNYEIVGIYNSGFQELDETYFLGDIKHVQRLNKWNKEQILVLAVPQNRLTDNLG